ncbi:MAG: CehA/McbA family metallohydrolase [Anaerolineae bacterium]
MNIVLKGHITPTDKARSDYLYLPFELPAPASRLHVQYSFSASISSDQREGGNVIDIGLFDPRGADFPGGAGFRGWSGSARRKFTITPASGTPGYLPGPLPAGHYQIILGLYRISPHGADYTIEIEADLGGGAEETRRQGDKETRREGKGEESPCHPPSLSPPHPRSPAPLHLRSIWLRGDLQTHTEHSDAKGTLAQLAARARGLDLNFLAVTDHNTVSHHAHMAALARDDPSTTPPRGSGRRLLLIPGQEVTTYYGHMNIWGTHRWCDFRCKTNEDMAAVIDLAHASGALCSINHPKTDGPTWKYDTTLPVDAMEVWQGPWPWRNEESLALWDSLLNAGRRLPAVGGSDYHCPPSEETNFLWLGQPTTWVKAAERSAPAILDAIRAGRVSISATPKGPRLDIRAMAGTATAEMGEELALAPGTAIEVEVQVERGVGRTLRLIADGALAHEEPITTAPATVRVALAAERYLRAELIGDVTRELLSARAPNDLDLRGWRWALSNPVYVAYEDHLMRLNREERRGEVPARFSAFPPRPSPRRIPRESTG